MNAKQGVLALATLAATAGLTGCAHFIMRGSIAEVEGKDEAQVCLGDHEVKVGDRVALFKMVCRGWATGKASAPACSKERVGEGTVTRTLNEHMSIIKVDPNVPFKEGTIVEKE